MAYANDFTMDFHDAVNEISVGLDNGLPRATTPFQQVSVFLFHWRDDDRNIVALEDELAEVFEKLYHYKVYRYVVDPSSSGNLGIQLNMKISQFMEETDGPDNLLIYVYSGYAWLGTETWEFHLQQVFPTSCITKEVS